MQHHEWLAGHIASLEEKPKKTSTTFEDARDRLRERSEARTRRLVIAALGEFYRKGRTPEKRELAEKQENENEVHPHSDHAQRLKHGGAFTTV